MREHKAIRIPIKTAEVDINIIPLVNLVNNFEDIYTTESCQGGSAGLPYVSFISFNYEQVITLLKLFQDAPCQITIEDRGSNLEPIGEVMKYSYIIQMKDRKEMQQTIRWIRKKYHSYFDYKPKDDIFSRN
ncbi:hypothetical protein LCGC14_1192510 [marine sediment metagenome]|uniref:Uncharacterized protein n=1 Tax=marine sediment metagenome TaxID=412755 RepID=A0A0F9P1M9_9ZZZZ